MQWLDRTPVSLLVIFSILFGLAPFVPEPHALEKIRMLVHGDLRRPIDIFDLVFHLLPSLLLLLRLARVVVRKKQHADD
ncbi:MAG: RND transporter [Desulfobulbaceae bacterium]|nr:RND transporter [Desulfobulbaceae bacterium]